MEKRRENRIKKRVMVKFGENNYERLGFTSNISSGGLHIASTQILPSGREITILLEDNDRVYSLKGEVRWSIKYPSHFYSYMLSGMGVKLKDIPLEFKEYLRRSIM